MSDIVIPEDNLKYPSSLTTYEDIYIKVYEYLCTKEGTKNVLSTTVLTTLMSIISSIPAGLSTGILSAEQEAFLQTAVNKESILAKCSLDFGIFVDRKNPAYISVEIQNTSIETIIIPKFSKFTIGQTNLFNRDKIIIASAETMSVTLYEGEKVEESFTIGNSYDTLFLTKNNNFTISTVDIYAQDLTTKEVYECITEPLFTTGPNSEPYVQQVTLPEGSVMLKLGNGIYGKLPSKGSIMSVYYIKTKGKLGNKTIEEDSKITYSENSDLVILSKSSLIEGKDELSSEYYRNFAPGMKSSLVIGGNVTIDQLKSRALSFTDVVDCQLLGQKDTFPTNLRYLNVVQASVLTSKGVLPDTEWDSFVSHMKQKTNFEFTKVDPEGVNIDINIEVYVNKDLNSASTKNNIQTAFNQYFIPNINYIGKSFYLSDIGKILRSILGSKELIRYNIVFPTENKIISKTQYLVLRNLTINLFSE